MARELIEIDLSPEKRLALAQRASHRVLLRWFGHPISVGFEQPRAAQIIRHRYRAFAAEATPLLRVFAVRSDDGSQEPVFFSDEGAAYRYPAALRGDEVIAFLADASLQRAYFDINKEISSFHAAAVKVGNVAAAISAVSTGGKTTTAIACARRGMGLYTDERCVLKGGIVHPFPRAVNIRSGGLELLASDDVPADGGVGQRLRSHMGDEWISASLGDVLGTGDVPEPAPLESIFFIIGRGRFARVDTLDRRDAMVQLLHAGLCGPLPGLDRVGAATALCKTTRAYSLILGTPDETALLVAATTRRASPLIAVTSA